MRHGVADAEECVCECHTGHRCGVSHLLAGFDIGLTVLVCSGQVVEYDLECLLCESVGVVGRHNGGIGLERVGDCVDTGGGGQSLGGAHVEVGVNYCHVGHKLIVCEGILNARCLVGDNGEGSYLAAGTCRGRDSDEIRLFAHLREGVDALADIHEAHCHIHEVRLGMLVENPHDFCRVHSGAAAQGDYRVRLEGSHLLNALFGALERRVGSNVAEGRVYYAHLVELIGYRLGVAVFVKEVVGDYERSLLAHDVLELIESDGQAALLDIDLLRCSEPKHILSPLSHGLDVDKMLDADVLADAVAAP